MKIADGSSLVSHDGRAIGLVYATQGIHVDPCQWFC